eukprot:CAMPEP_0113415324 /NCGR_PEP_ID=MMETSP0013_2-20120614/24503_1 /TAXON_ID=2843 ORGANISM="Skeletonema costatum, Strain 1716" /NCGR_SAMPLE_ID=MMETSP0013_2 /ASSEMBLY_ACC=CAM_ASM_000158 /LENGTH=727 /DNA_ID=CAMNT_0000302267 /DNA_START=447 /DNA_END=2630 /DNA_ORIENTATION=+ /assembly_acc=CAM_ASM_000158
MRAMHSHGNHPRPIYQAHAPHLPPYAGTPRQYHVGGAGMHAPSQQFLSTPRFYMGPADPIHREKMLANARMRMAQQEEITPQQRERMERNRIIALAKKANHSQYAAQVRLDSASAASISSNQAVAAMPAYEGSFGSPEDIEACEIIAQEDEKENVGNQTAAAADDDQKPPAKRRSALPTPKQLHKASVPLVQPMICQEVADVEAGYVDDVAPPDDDVHDARDLTEAYIYRGNAFSKGNSLKDKREYRCCNLRKHKCKAKLYVHDATGVVSHPKNSAIEHSEACKVANGFGQPSGAERGSGTRNVTRDMFIYVDTLASVQGNINATKIADDCLLHFNTLYPDGYFGYKRNQLVARAYNTNRQSRGGCEIVGLESQHMANGDEGTAVLRGNVAFTEPNRKVKSFNQKQRVVSFSHTKLMKMMKSDKLQTQVDCTFRCCPKPFYQCLIWVLWDRQVEMFVPCYWVLMTGKTAACYDVAFHMIKTDLNGDFNPYVVGIDFERNFINMVKKHWPDANLVGCFFHFKQAIRQYLKSELCFPDKVVSLMMRKGMIDLATVLPADDVNSINGKGWLFIASLIECTSTGNDEADDWIRSVEGKTKLADFYAYVSRFWLSADVFETWNWSTFLEWDPKHRPVFRTNCWMESYNGRMNRDNTVHPRLMAFFDVLREEQTRIVNLVDQVRNEHADAPIYAPIAFPKIPREYDDFVVPDLKKMNLTTRPKGAAKRKRGGN